MMAIKSEIKQWMFHKVALLNHCFQVEFSGGRKTIGRGENPRLLMDCVSCQTSASFFKPSISNISVFSSSMASFVSTCVFIVSSKIFLIVSLLKVIFLFLPQVEEIFATITLNTTRHCVGNLFFTLLS